jgi:predicted amidohydrolase
VVTWTRTAVLIDSGGEALMAYRKVHLYRPGGEDVAFAPKAGQKQILPNGCVVPVARPTASRDSFARRARHDS